MATRLRASQHPEPASHVPLRYVLNAGYHHLANWALKKQEPPHGEPIALESLNPVVIARDSNGISLGGIRQADVEVPIAINRGDQVNMTPGCPGNYGMHVPFSDATLSQLYPSKADYVRAVTEAVKRNVYDGFLLKEDGDEVIHRAMSSSVGSGRSIPIH
jgi:hypothetical protein